MTDDELRAMEADANRESALRAEARWTHTPPPWKAVGWPVGEPDRPGCYGMHWSVTNDAGDPRDEYDVFEAPDEGLAKWVAEMPTLAPALASHTLALVAEVKQLREQLECVRLKKPHPSHQWTKGFDSQCFMCEAYEVPPSSFLACDPSKTAGKVEACCECGEDYPRRDLLRGEVFCGKCRSNKGSI